MGTIIAPQRQENWKFINNDGDSWIKFRHINGLLISGGGTIDGQGVSWWEKSDRPTVS